MANPSSIVFGCHSLMERENAAGYTDDVGLPLRIREIRKERGLTLAQLADVVGISTPHMSQVERGIKNVNNHLLERIAVALRVQPYELISSGSPTRSTLDEILDLLPPDDRARVETFARNLLTSRDQPPDSE